MNLERVKDITTILQSVLIAIALVIGGAWTIFLFFTQRPDLISERDRFAQAIINIDVQARQLDMDETGGLYIFAVASLENQGNRTGVLDLRERPPFRISRIVFTGDPPAVGKLDAPIAARNVTQVTSSALGARAKDQFHAFVRVPEPGHYYVEFMAPLSQTDFTDDKSIPKEAVNWWGATTVEVRKDNARASERK